FLHQRHDLCRRRLLDLLQFEASRHLSKSEIRIRALQASGKAVAQELFVFIGLASVESFQPRLCLVAGGRVGKLRLRLASCCDKKKGDDEKCCSSCVIHDCTYLATDYADIKTDPRRALSRSRPGSRQS